MNPRWVIESNKMRLLHYYSNITRPAPATSATFVRRARQRAGRSRRKFFAFFPFFRSFPLKFWEKMKKSIFSDLEETDPTPLRRRPHRKSEISRVSKGRKAPSANRIRELIRPASASASRAVAEKIFYFFFICFAFFL